jgi:HEAT repeat protein
MKGLRIALASLALALAAGGRAAAAAAPARAEVEAALRKSGREAESELPRLAASAEPVLIAIADDRAVDAAVRARAVAALAYARGPRVHVFLENLVLRKTPSSDPTDRLLLRRAAVALGWQAGPRVVETVAPLLGHADAEVRLDAAVALGLSRARDAEGPLRARLAEEPDASVRRQIESALKSIAPPPAAR